MPPLEIGARVTLEKTSFDDLLTALRQQGYETLGPRVKDDAITYGPILDLADLPRGYTSQQDAGEYRLVYSGHSDYFRVTPGPQSWKQVFFPPRTEMFSMHRQDGRSWQVEKPGQKRKLFALVGVRPCELAAIQVQDRAFLRPEYQDPGYRAARQSAFILAVNCLHPEGSCFCVSMGTGPRAGAGYDLCLTELDDVFLVDIGSEAGRMVMTDQPWMPASAYILQIAEHGLAEAAQNMGRTMLAPERLPKELLNNLDNPRYDDVARRCLSCTNCTQVCPTCFCWEVEEITNLDRSQVRRERVWDSCFNPMYSHVFGGSTRPNTRARYRQWITHKLASWHVQFGVSGCVGCGRCITWCPAGIDITQEAAALLEEVSA